MDLNRNLFDLLNLLEIYLHYSLTQLLVLVWFYLEHTPPPFHYHVQKRSYTILVYRAILRLKYLMNSTTRQEITHNGDDGGHDVLSARVKRDEKWRSYASRSCDASVVMLRSERTGGT